MEFTENEYISKKINSALSLSAFIDIAIVLLLCGIIFSSYIVRPPENKEDYLAMANFFNNANAMKFFGLTYAVYCLANILLLLSPLRSTLGMLITQIKMENLSDNKRINITQAIGFFLLYRTFFAANFIFIFYACFNFQTNIYYGLSGAFLLFYTTIILNSIYILRYGGWLNAQEHILGISTIFTTKKAEKLKQKWLKKSTFSKSISIKISNITSIAGKYTPIPLIILMTYLSSLIVLDFFKTPYMEQEIYKPYAINWTRDNGYFALQGLNAPADTRDFIEFGRSHVHENFLKIDELKGLIDNFYRFEKPNSSDFIKVDKDFKPLEYQPLNPAHESEFFICYVQIEKNNSDRVCATDKDIVDTISKNKILWDRFNQLPDFKEFQRPDIGIHGVFRAQSLINLVRLKGADIIRLQKTGYSQEAFKEWVRFAKFYRRLTESKVTMVGKAVNIITYAVHYQVLEKLLYNDPQLAKNHYNLIAETLNPQGVSMFRGQKIFADDFSEMEIYILADVYPSSGIRNKMFDCMKEQEKLSNLPAYQFPFGKTLEKICKNIQGEPWQIFVNSTFLTTGNPFTSNIQALLYVGFIKGGVLIANMHIKDTEMRMALLGAKIYKDNIAPKDIAHYIQNAPIELQNPITQKPFEWNEKDHQLFFTPPIKDEAAKTFSINFDTP